TSLGGGFSRVVHHRGSRVYVRPAWRGARARSAHHDLPRHFALLGGGRHWQHAPLVFLGYAGRPHGVRSILLGRRGHPADVPNAGSVEFPPTWNGVGEPCPQAFPTSLGGYVSGLGRFLELPRSWNFRFPHQLTNSFVLRDRHRTHSQSWARGN